MIKKIFPAIVLLSILWNCSDDSNHDEIPPVEEEFIRAVDFSFLPEIEQGQVIFYDMSGNPGDPLEILRDAGCNTVRIRLWHTPQNGHSGLEEATAFSRRVRDMGMNVWLCVHYSDTWADEGQQNMPSAWQGLDLESLKDSVYTYTKRITQVISPDIIQIGNEINLGFLWDAGRISNGENFYQLLGEGTRAVREVSDARIMVHYAGLYAGSFYQNLRTRKVDYDYIGLSYYPIWHGKDLGVLVSAISSLGKDNGKKVVIAETSYPFTLEWNDMTHNVIGLQDQILPQYPATLQGQKDYLIKIKSILKNDKNGQGFCYWGGEWVAFKGPDALDGSSWENQALFDFSNKALPVMDAFRE